MASDRQRRGAPGPFPWIWGLAMAGLICLGLPCGPVARAEEPIAVEANTHAFTFGRWLRFQLGVSSDAPIQSIVLAYRSSDTGGTIIEPMSLTPATRVAVEYEHQIADRYVRPFIEISYWWTIENAEGVKLITEPISFTYADDRFDWQTLRLGEINLHWYQGSVQVAQQALEVAAAAMARVREDVRIAAIADPIEIYLYSQEADLQLALPAGLPPGTDALTLHGTTVVLVPLGPEAANIPDLKRILPHEVTHAVLYAATLRDFDRMPLWLVEGLATSIQHEFAPDPGAQILLREALARDELIDVNTMCATLPDDWSRARLAYLQSASLVDYIRGTYGRQALQDLIAAYADGVTCERGVQRVFGLSLERLETAWRESLAPHGGWDRFWQENGAWIVLIVALSGVSLSFVRPKALWRSIETKEST